MNIFTEKLAGRGEIDLVKSGLLPQIREINFCEYGSCCSDIEKLNLSIKQGIPDKDLMDQYYELCIHPAEEVREISCGEYRSFKTVERILNKTSKGIEEYYEEKQNLLPPRDFKEMSQFNKSIRKRGD